MARISVLTSGGVDSSLALCRLAEERRHELVAVYIKIWLEDELAFLGSCPWQEDLDLVRAVCELTGVPLEVVSLQREYRETVIAYTLDELRAGRTPSPDILCNLTIKFGALVERLAGDFDAVASGHYARTVHRHDTTRLVRASDPAKDQTYFLCRLGQSQVSRCLFPIGHLRKKEVRAEALERGLANAQRPDSQGLCFLGRVPYDDFVEYHLGRHPGPIVEDVSGRLLGEHRGHWFYTIGQRRGLGLAGGPWYVVAKDPRRNEVRVTHGESLAGYRRRSFRIVEPNWIAEPATPGPLEVRIRHGERFLPCTVEGSPDGPLDVTLEDGDTGIAAGQFAVLYDRDECLGGGPIAG